jgi:peptide/nickel transport system substrate-binding protein
VVVRQLKAVGLDAWIEVVDPAQERALYGSRQFDLLVAEVTPHTLADPDQFMQSVKGGYLWREGKSYPALDALVAKWREASTAEARTQVGYELQQLHSEAPATLMLYYPKAFFAYRPKAFDHWRLVPGMGVFHKWSLVDFFNTPAWVPQ